jgi:hypothetical protein
MRVNLRLKFFETPRLVLKIVQRLVTEKRQRTDALQEASRLPGIINPHASVLDCGGPPPLFRIPRVHENQRDLRHAGEGVVVYNWSAEVQTPISENLF